MTAAATVEVRLRINSEETERLTLERDEIKRTPCEQCGHAWASHDSITADACVGPWPPTGEPCSCRRYLDPAEPPKSRRKSDGTQRRDRVTPERLDEIAAAYRAGGIPAIKAMGFSDRWARYLKRRCVQAGLLGPDEVVVPSRLASAEADK